MLGNLESLEQLLWQCSAGLSENWKMWLQTRGWAGKKPSTCAKTRYPAFVFGLLVIPAYRPELSGYWERRFFSCVFQLRKWKLLPEKIQRIKNLPAFFLQDILYRLGRNQNVKDKNQISRSGTNTWFLFRSTPTADCNCAWLHKIMAIMMKRPLFSPREAMASSGWPSGYSCTALLIQSPILLWIDLIC